MLLENDVLGFSRHNLLFKHNLLVDEIANSLLNNSDRFSSSRVKDSNLYRRSRSGIRASSRYAERYPLGHGNPSLPLRYQIPHNSRTQL